MVILVFQYQPLHEGLPGRNPGTLRNRFQYQPLHEGLLYSLRRGEIAALFQYQPLHEGLRDHALLLPDLRLISIPAPPRGASVSVVYFLAGIRISIPAPPRGASLGHTGFTVRHHFNTSPSTRGFLDRVGLCGPPRISIPAPPRGASVDSKAGDADGAISIPAPPRGASPTQ